MEKNLFWIVVVNAIVLEIWSLVTIFRNALGFVVHSCLFCVVGYNSMISLSIELIGNGILLWGIFKRKASFVLSWLFCYFYVVGSMTGSLIQFKFSEEGIRLDAEYTAKYIYCACSIVAGVLLYRTTLKKCENGPV